MSDGAAVNRESLTGLRESLIRELVTVIRRQATVVSVLTEPNRVECRFHTGDPTFKARYLSSYTPTIGDVVFVWMDRGDPLVVGTLSPGIQQSRIDPWKFSFGSAAVVGATGSHRSDWPETLIQGRMRVITAPAGSAFTVQLQRAAAATPTTWASVGSALSIAAGSVTEVTVTLSQAMAVGDLLRANVTSVGSSTPAGGGVVEVRRTAT